VNPIFGPAPKKAPQAPPSQQIIVASNAHAGTAKTFLLMVAAGIFGASCVGIPQYLNSLRQIRTPEEIAIAQGASYVALLPDSPMYGFYQNNQDKKAKPQWFMLRITKRQHNQFAFTWYASPQDFGTGLGSGIGTITADKKVSLEIKESLVAGSDPQAAKKALLALPSQQVSSSDTQLWQFEGRISPNNPNDIYMTGSSYQRQEQVNLESYWLVQPKPPEGWRQPPTFR
jgi:hypothetical protein